MTNLSAIIAIAFRDVTKLLRDKTRILASLVFPAIFIGVLGTSLQANLQTGLSFNFLTFVFTGVLAQTLFQSTAAGIISLVEDRQNDFAQELFIAPVSHHTIILGKILGESAVSFIQVLGVVAFGLVIGVPIVLPKLLLLLPLAAVISFFGGSFGVLVMSRASEQRGVNQIFPFLIFPQFFLAGVFSPIRELPLPVLIASRLTPMTYAVDLVRSIYYLGDPVFDEVVLFNPIFDLGVVLTVSVVFILIGTHLFVQNEKKR
ncbi:MAG: hypothetical protein COU69_01950 [Candidatus Pacebacteria bacterium CG10_big_fil_rev_8_21_14_0_10_56_10]|nr:MAG: hypothetical protein COU69_01950 [Candidatus Pacebacteria bacterium CG10_big_fil_rev_8_21_14_0_10_56_10]